jgi:hypothetical protein
MGIVPQLSYSGLCSIWTFIMLKIYSFAVTVTKNINVMQCSV